MSDTTAAILILPTLAVLTVVLECSRIGCTHLFRRIRKPRAIKVRQSATA